jgi:CCR4-NOT transcriptional regulation complex NOT5 subunit
LESKLEELNSNKKKKTDREKTEATKRRIDVHKKYIESLERIASMLKKNVVDVNMVQDIKSDVELYIENSEQGELSESQDNLDIFEELLENYDSTCMLSFFSCINFFIMMI